jgi:hypothetical protein
MPLDLYLDSSRQAPVLWNRRYRLLACYRSDMTGSGDEKSGRLVGRYCAGTSAWCHTESGVAIDWLLMRFLEGCSRAKQGVAFNTLHCLNYVHEYLLESNTTTTGAESFKLRSSRYSYKGS